MNGTGDSLRPHEAASFEALAEQAQPMTVPPKYLDQVAALATKDKHMTAEGVDAQCRLRNGSQTIEASAHVGHASN